MKTVIVIIINLQDCSTVIWMTLHQSRAVRACISKMLLTWR